MEVLLYHRWFRAASFTAKKIRAPPGHVTETHALPKFSQEVHTSSFQILAAWNHRKLMILWGIIWSPGFLWLRYILNNSSATDAVGRNWAYVLHRGIVTEANWLQCEEFWKAHVVHCVGGEEKFPCLHHSFYQTTVGLSCSEWVLLPGCLGFRDRVTCFSLWGT